MFTEDLTAYFSTDDFAETIAIDGTNVTALVGMSDVVQDETYPQVLMETKDVVVKATDVGTIVVGQDVTVDTDIWRVVGKQNQGSGILRLTINRSLS